MDHGTYVVCFGYESVLLESRRRVLATRFHAIAVTTLEALQHNIAAGYVRLLVVCHTVPELDCLAAVAMANNGPTDIKTVLLIFHTVPVYAPVQTIGAYEGPAALLNRLSELLNGNSLAIGPTQSKSTRSLSSRPVPQLAEALRAEVWPGKRRSYRPQT